LKLLLISLDDLLLSFFIFDLFQEFLFLILEVLGKTSDSLSELTVLLLEFVGTQRVEDVVFNNL